MKKATDDKEQLDAETEELEIFVPPPHNILTLLIMYFPTLPIYLYCVVVTLPSLI